MSAARTATSGAVDGLGLVAVGHVLDQPPAGLGGLRTSTIRSGWLFIAVGAHFTRS